MTEKRDELTVDQAARLLRVSTAYVKRLLDESKLPFRTASADRLIYLDALLAYKLQNDEAHARIADELTADAQELGTGY